MKPSEQAEFNRLKQLPSVVAALGDRVAKLEKERLDAAQLHRANHEHIQALTAALAEAAQRIQTLESTKKPAPKK